ncbi:cytochrome P450 [Mycolicibacterium rhodesiae JS60]|nr:cytochrome P450 [Mycolicibacterium rhodesiae JS60]
MAKSAEEILTNLDLFDPEQGEHMEEALALARQKCPIVHSPNDGGYFLLTRYDDVRSVAERPEEFSSAEPAVRGMGIDGVRLIPLDSDQPLHRDFRKFLNKYFSLTYVRRHEEKMREICKGLIDKFEPNGHVEFVHDYAIPLTAGVLSHLIFTNETEEFMLRAVALVERVAADLSPEAFLELGMMALEALNRADDSGDDENNILSAIKTATVDGGRPLTLEEQMGIVAALLAGGLDTTRSALANIAFHLATRPDVEERLRDPQWVRNDLDEFLRLQPTVSFMARTATRDTTIGEREFKKGDRIVLSYRSANRDETRFENSGELAFGVDRKASAAFGLGIHRCIGQHLAKLQIEVGFDELLSRLTKFRVETGAEIPRQVGVSAGAPEHLPLLFERL